jgi:GNAT superfamily N-acetyltransferase
MSARPRAAAGEGPRPALRIEPATAARWADLERLFGPRGACAGCWCMWPRLTAAEFARGKGAANRRAMRRLVAAGERPGLIAYAGREPVGWCALAPRAAYRRFERSRVLAPVDEVPVWSVPCFFVARGWRRRGVTAALLEAAKGFAARRGAVALEGYPIDPRGARLADVFVWHGLASAFRRAGFAEVARRSPTRPIMRAALAPRVRRARAAKPARG